MVFRRFYLKRKSAIENVKFQDKKQVLLLTNLLSTKKYMSQRLPGLGLCENSLKPSKFYIYSICTVS